MESLAFKYSGVIKPYILTRIDKYIQHNTFYCIHCEIPSKIVQLVYNDKKKLHLLDDCIKYATGKAARTFINTTPDLKQLYIRDKRTKLYPRVLLIINIHIDSVKITMTNIDILPASPKPDKILFQNFDKLDEYKVFLRKMDCLNSVIPDDILIQTMGMIGTFIQRSNDIEYTQFCKILGVTTHKFNLGLQRRLALCIQCKMYSYKTLVCSVCKNARYCSCECQLKHWKKHINKCKRVG